MLFKNAINYYYYFFATDQFIILLIYQLIILVTKSHKLHSHISMYESEIFP